MLIDTDVLIWYIRGNNNAFKVIENLDKFFISSVTYMELVQGMRSKAELNNLRKALLNWKAEILYLTEEINIKAIFFLEQYFLSHALSLTDALICATAINHNLPLLSGNEKHYKVLKKIELKLFRA